MNSLPKYSIEEIDVVNHIEELQHFQRLIDNGEQKCAVFNESPGFELKQYYQKRQKIYQNLLDALLKLQFRTPKMNEILRRLLEKHEIQLPQKETSAIDENLEQVAALLT